jgi:hypothetical protein
MFDDSTYEQFTIDELLKNPDAYSRYQKLEHGIWLNAWDECTVLDFDPETRIFTIEWVDTGKRKQVTRFNLRFEKEDPDRFEQRIDAAKRACARYETMLRFESRISQMPTEGLPLLSAENMSTIRTRMGMKEVPKLYRPILVELEREVAADFQ